MTENMGFDWEVADATVAPPEERRSKRMGVEEKRLMVAAMAVVLLFVLLGGLFVALYKADVNEQARRTEQLATCVQAGGSYVAPGQCINLTKEP